MRSCFNATCQFTALLNLCLFFVSHPWACVLLLLRFFFFLLTNATLTHPADNQKETDLKMNSCHSNFSSSNMYELWVIKRLCSKTCESESDCP